MLEKSYIYTFFFVNMEFKNVSVSVSAPSAWDAIHRINNWIFEKQRTNPALQIYEFKPSYRVDILKGGFQYKGLPHIIKIEKFQRVVQNKKNGSVSSFLAPWGSHHQTDKQSIYPQIEIKMYNPYIHDYDYICIDVSLGYKD